MNTKPLKGTWVVGVFVEATSFSDSASSFSSHKRKATVGTRLRQVRTCRTCRSWSRSQKAGDSSGVRVKMEINKIVVGHKPAPGKICQNRLCWCPFNPEKYIELQKGAAISDLRLELIKRNSQFVIVAPGASHIKQHKTFRVRKVFRRRVFVQGT